MHITVPRRSPHAILSVIGSRCNPNEGMETACNQLDELSEDTESIPAVSNSLPELLSKSSYFLKYRPLSHHDWKIWIWGSSSKPESFFHSLAAISKYWFNCRDYEDEFKLSRSLTNFSVALTLDKYPDKETFIAGLSPKPPLETLSFFRSLIPG